MLAELRDLHREIISRLDDLNELTMASEPSLVRLAAVRLALTRASRARTTLVESLYNQLLGAASRQEQDALTALASEGRGALISSIHHIGTWSLSKVSENWDEYRSASQKMQGSMRTRVSREAEILYPALMRSSTRLPMSSRTEFPASAASLVEV